MEKHIIQFFKFLQDKEGKSAPLKVKLLSPEVFGKPTKEQLVVKHSLDLSETDIKELPQGLKVSGFLNLRDCTSLEKLPQGLKVSEQLILTGCTSLKELPQGLEVGKGLSVRRTPIAKKYSEKEIRKMIEDGGGFVNGPLLAYI